MPRKPAKPSAPKKAAPAKTKRTAKPVSKPIAEEAPPWETPREISKKAGPAQREMPTKEGVYQFLMDRCLTLSPEHALKIEERGLSPEEIVDLGYKSFPIKRKEIVGKLVDEFGADTLINAEIPGFFRGQSGSVEIAGRAGIAIPVRAMDGSISALKIRVDKPQNSTKKYLLLSSNPSPDKKTGEIKYPFGSSAKASVHWPLGRQKKVKTLRITEGEVKADIASSLTEVYTISLPGINMWRMALEAISILKPERVLISFDADKARVNTPAGYAKATREAVPSGQLDLLGDAPIDPAEEEFLVGKAVSALYMAIREDVSLGIKSLGIEDWPDTAGKGIDDVLVNGKADEIRIMEGEDAEIFVQAMLASDMPDGWVYIVGTKRFIHAKTLIELDKEQYSDRYCHVEKGNPALNALRNPALRKCDFPIYLPNQEMFLQIGDKKLFNTWRKGLLEPKKGDVTKFLKHCAYMLPDESDREIFLDWMAYNVQNPGRKILWSILLQGQQGTGKSYFGLILKWILGESNVSFPTNELIHEVYTAWQKSCQLVVIEEIMARGRLELMNKLKPMITQDTTIVREMHKAAYEQPNVFNILMFTNHEDAIIIDSHDRRYCVLFSPAKPVEHKYYQELWKWTQEHKAEIFQFFLDRDLAKFQPLGRAPMTEGKKTLIRESMPALQSWVEESIEGTTWPFLSDIVCVNHLLSCIPSAIKFITPQGLARALKAAGCQQLGQTRLKAGNSLRLWSVRRHEIWGSAEEETRAHEYERWSNTGEPGGNALLESRPI